MVMGGTSMKTKHQHSWIKWRKWQGSQHWKCADPDCFETIEGALLEGKRTLCPQCHETSFILTKDLMRRVKPKCINCRDTKDAVQQRRFAELSVALLDPPKIEEVEK
jgi:ssDNA-binding Zn-finger/Zn-ribbon topoisomerase 1